MDQQIALITLCVSMETGVVMIEAHNVSTLIEVGIVSMRHNVCTSIEQDELDCIVTILTRS